MFPFAFSAWGRNLLVRLAFTCRREPQRAEYPRVAAYSRALTCATVTHQNHPFSAPSAPCISVRASPRMTLTFTM
jgi:hypothetical protein